MTCYSCQEKNLVGTIFCFNCGVSLLPQDRKYDTTAMLGSGSANSTAPNSSLTQRVHATNERRFRATLLSNGRKVDLPLAVPVLIGRQDNARGFFPDLDLNNDGGYDSGVSRRHARISIMDEAVYVEDLESANGTFINGQRVQARTPYRLQHSDELRFGSLTLRIEQL